MNRKEYFDYIEEQLNILSTRIKTRAKMNILDLNLHSENFYAGLLNVLYDMNFVNLNSENQNAAAVDLIDEENQVIAQVTSTITRAKIEKSLSNKVLENSYKGYSFWFIVITDGAESLRGKEYKNPYGIEFDSESDIYDVTSILKDVKDIKSIRKMKSLYEFIKTELGEPQDIPDENDIIQKYLEEVWNELPQTKIDNKTANKIWRVIKDKLKDGPTDQMISLMGKLFYQNHQYEEEILEQLYDIWESVSVCNRGHIISVFAQNDVDFWNPWWDLEISFSLRNKFLNALMNSFENKEKENIVIMFGLLEMEETISSDNKRKEMWDKFLSLDNYSKLSFLNKIETDYIVPRLFESDNKDIDIEGLKKLSESEDKKIRVCALNVIAQMPYIKALDIINNTDDFNIEFHNAGNVLYCILACANVQDYQTLFNSAKDKIFEQYNFSTQKNPYYLSSANLVLWGDYELGKLSLTDMLDKIKTNSMKNNRFEYRCDYNVLSKKLATLLQNEENTQYFPKIKKIIAACKKN